MHSLPFIFNQHVQALAEDEETPIHLFMKETRGQPGILLESVEVDGRWGRHTLVAKDFLLLFTPVDGKLHVRVQDSALKEFEQLNGMPWFEGLREACARIRIRTSAPASARGSATASAPASATASAPASAPDSATDSAPASVRGSATASATASARTSAPASATASARTSAELPAITRALYGYMGYGISGLMEPKLAAALPAHEAESTLALPGTVFLFDHMYNKLTRLSLTDADGRPFEALLGLSDPLSGHRGDDAEGEPETGPISVQPDAHEYMAMVRDIKEHIRRGDVIQVVVSTGFSAPFRGDAFRLYRRLRRLNPSPYMFFMRLPGVTLFGSSPEVLISADKNQLRLCPIAGTRPRGRNEGEDDLFSLDLIQDPKERAEHVMLVDLGRNDLGRVAASGTVRVDRYMEVERFSHVMHLTSYVSATLAPDKDAFDVIAAAFPAGTVSGAPKIRAMELIAGLEQRARGPYAGAIGWIGLDRDSSSLDLGITIRSAWVRQGRLYWQAGAGIVFDSDPELEWKECNNKAAALRSVFEGDRHVSADR